MIYVTMTDKFLSGWGMAEGRIAKYVYECDTLEEARIVVENAENRKDQKNINICYSKPYYNSNTHRVEYLTKAEHPSWYTAGYFRKNN